VEAAKQTHERGQAISCGAVERRSSGSSCRISPTDTRSSPVCRLGSRQTLEVDRARDHHPVFMTQQRIVLYMWLHCSHPDAVKVLANTSTQ
jgi:hypothetical protein